MTDLLHAPKSETKQNSFVCNKSKFLIIMFNFGLKCLSSLDTMSRPLKHSRMSNFLFKKCA